VKTTIKIEKEVDIRAVLINISPRHIGDSGDDDMPTDFPLLNEQKTAWVASVDIDTGAIAGWPQGNKLNMHVKVCDAGTYKLIDGDGNIVAERINDYVPHGVVPGAYGDYVELEINENGIITNWPKHPDISEFFGEDY
jgi:hypothetical protein